VDTFQAHVLQMTAKVRRTIVLNEHQGSAIRGAFFQAVRGRFCFDRNRTSCVACPLHVGCPICALVASVDDGSARGVDVPRPFVVVPPLNGKVTYEVGEDFDFGITLFGNMVSMLPYMVAGLREMGEMGIGKRVNGTGPRKYRGTFDVERIAAVNPLSGAAQEILDVKDGFVHVPTTAVTQANVVKVAAGLPADRIAVDLLTPLRLIENGRLVRPLRFAPLSRRLLDRLEALGGRYGGGGPAVDFADLARRAQGVEAAVDETRWVELESYSTRQGRATPMGGCLGRIVFAGDLAPFLPWLVWGQVVHVGKDATKGNGIIRLSDPGLGP